MGLFEKFFKNKESDHSDEEIIKAIESGLEQLEKGIAYPDKPIKPAANNVNPYDASNVNMLEMGLSDGKSNEEGGATRAPGAVDFSTLKHMSRIPIISSIIQTRINQVAEFAHPIIDGEELGFKIRLKDRSEMDDNDREAAQKITNFLMTCGDPRTNYEINFEAFLRQLVRDSLIFDQACFEIVKNRAGDIVSFTPVDASTIRRAKLTEKEQKKGRRDLTGKTEYVQVLDNRIVAEFGPKDLCFGIRRPRSWVEVQGYGFPELEELVRVTTSMLNAEYYNASNFTNGISAAGIIAIKSKMSPQVFRAFRREFYAMLSGAQNTKKTPVIQLDPDSNEDLKSLNFSSSNKDMEFGEWINYLIKICCAIYALDPAELGFVYGNEGSKASLNAKGPTERVLLSREKGLRPLIRAVQNWINHWLINQIDERFELVFVGLDGQSEADRLELDIKKVQHFMTINEIRATRGLPALKNGDVILHRDMMEGLGVMLKEADEAGQDLEDLFMTPVEDDEERTAGEADKTPRKEREMEKQEDAKESNDSIKEQPIEEEE